MFRQQLNRDMQNKAKGKTNLENPNYVLSIELIPKRSMMFYVPGDPQTQMFKFTVALPRHCSLLAKQVLPYTSLPSYGGFGFETFESSVDYVLRFMIERHMYGATWIEIPGGKYRLRTPSASVSSLQYEVDVDYQAVTAHLPVGDWLHVAPLRILSFDIECAGRKGIFPDPLMDPVIQIANYVTVHGKATPVVRNVFTLKSCAAIVGAEVLSYDDEKAMLDAWAKFVVASDPDILTGYNIVNFDLPYLLNRAKKLGAKEFPLLGRLKGRETTMRDTQMSSSGFGTHESKLFTMDGRIIMDMLQIITRDYKLRSYSLNSVCADFLGEQKEDVHHSIITDLQNGNEDTRRRLAVYCLKDAYLPQRLMDRLMSLYNYMEMARVTGVPLSWLFARGQMIKVASLLYREARDQGFAVPDVETGGTTDGPQFEGAIVIPPQKGFYEVPIATLDFASLYPSIMMAHNLCYSTLVQKRDVARLDPAQYTRTPTGEYFVKAEVKRGVLSNILSSLLDARKRARADLKNETDPQRKAVLDGRQLALKVSANAVYGFTGASVGKLPCMEISGSVTAIGREMIEKTRALVESTYTIANGHQHDAVVIYGDTDSVMIKFGVTDVPTAMKMGQEAANSITKEFIDPIKLEFEKVYFPYLIINKKRYAGLLWTRPDKWDKIDTKGIETKRRDNCLLVAEMVETCLRRMLLDRDVEGAKNYTKNIISQLLQNKIDLSMLVISKSLAKTEYDSIQAHAYLAEKMKKRDPGSAPTLGDRVAYVITQGHKSAKAYERAEDPIYVLEHNMPIDAQYYLEHMLKKPLQRIFEPVMGNTSSLFSGEHTRTISKPTPSTGGIMAFTKKTLSCLMCKSPISDQEKTLCKYCRPRESEVYTKHLLTVSDLEEQFSALWTQCQRCQGSLHQDVLCTSRDCPIFYRRKKVQKDLHLAQETLDRFDSSW
eukprot:TRINITY_DN728_c0_g1::TRINITY_DN728_c0_g1_i1::g.18399::m.18399 TRINITY_DN728_c0_g1::TRINITY_DN728_c0_g1_i1::g.18399  ORF type:complete len:1039 (+),score=291.88,sp/Q9LVN7/DPOD1_ARATH/55.83/0.0,DNA_pol_B/PF00136.16/2.8e-136,DNA_pol_B_exo1/PF03104.14/1.3e-77,zf-C4pol/PF14260.1/1.3e-23,DNA_pol_B_2/PF03175.8/7.1,DNA_pol_B_2/PF03175.8/0.28,DNA_pol_B_2/PF03175.8/2e+02,DNA_pol_A_exo1/PF01612.15/3.9e+03,DNA_pol_A_exo1/PF01612.15/0.11,RNase_H_2/PF13482.1/0.28,zf-RING-like/PF08746.6/4e+03,zf-RING-like/PF08